nr:MAG TPA: hypothetical protein [Caudoviricetes sp.]
MLNLEIDGQILFFPQCPFLCYLRLISIKNYNIDKMDRK